MKEVYNFEKINQNPQTNVCFLGQTITLETTSFTRSAK